ncbi:adenylyl-sulfate kinase [Humibacter albus]|uniref:adenylyl-sulfate kinase n=1 Tax=Humibacter albus TaxID=427754 RepID=UPI0003B7317C|nr:adenylyl-sulfate kinase [Humibacter albus]
MTTNDIDWAQIAALPTLTIDGSDLDRLELALGTSGCRLRLSVPSNDTHGSDLPPVTHDVVLVDRQATPLAQLPGSRRGSAAAPLALRPRGGGHTAEWDEGVRMSAAASRARLADLGASRVVGVAFERLPTRADVDFLSEQLRREDTVVLVAALVGARDHRVLRGESRAHDERHEHDGLRVGAAGLTRAVSGLADELRAQSRSDRVVTIALPWSRHPSPGLLELQGEGLGSDVLLDRLLRAYGATQTVPPRPADDAERLLAEAAERWRNEVERALPPASAHELHRRRSRPHDVLPGAVILFTGLSGSGKSTLAQATATALRERGERTTVLDGDDMRRHLSSELGFDQRSRSLNVQRIGWVAALAASHGGVALAAPIAPFAADRAEVRTMAEASGAFLLVYVSTPLEECARRDRKGLYARAMAGEIPEFTGVSSPYEVPDDADVVVDTSTEPIEESLERVLAALERTRASGAHPHDA